MAKPEMVKPEFETGLISLILEFRDGGQDGSDGETIASFLQEIISSLREGTYEEDFG